MRKSQWWTIVAAAGVMAIAAAPQSYAQYAQQQYAQPQQQQQQQYAPVHQAMASPVSGGSVAVIDVNRIFKNHPQFKAAMEQMQADVVAAEAKVKQDLESIKGEAAQLEQFHSGTPDYKERETQLTRRRAELTTQIEMQKRDFLQRESKIYNTIYEGISQEVEYYAANNGISMVLRFTGDAVDDKKPDDVLRRINQPIVWYPKERDITQAILDRLIARGQSQGQPGQGQGVAPSASQQNNAAPAPIGVPQFR